MELAPEIRLIYMRLLKAGVAFIMVLLVGTFGYQILADDVSWFDGLYMTIVTVTTIGYEEVVNMENNIAGRVFTIIIAFFGIGVLTYILSNVAAMIIESDLSAALKKSRMEKEIAKLQNHYIICGGSRVGEHIANELHRTQRTFVLADLDNDVIDSFLKKFENGKALKGDCTQENFLAKLGLANAAGVFVTTQDDNTNLVICLTARQMNPSLRIVSHCKEIQNERKLRSVGAERVITSYSIGGMRMASEMVRPTVTTFLDEMLRDTNKNLRIEELQLPESYSGKQISDLPMQDLSLTLILAVCEADGWKYVPKPNYHIPSNCRLVLMTSPEELRTLHGRIY